MPPLREVPGSDPDPQPTPPVDPRAEDDPRGVDLWIMPYIEDSTLRPVLIVVMAHVVAFASPVVLLAVRDRSPGPIFATLILLGLTARGFRFEKNARGKFGAISWILVATWIFTGIAAYFANDMGIF